jgi:hypothetical protein
MSSGQPKPLVTSLLPLAALLSAVGAATTLVARAIVVRARILEKYMMMMMGIQIGELDGCWSEWMIEEDGLGIPLFS